MAFRSNEAAEMGFQHAWRYLVGTLPQENRQDATQSLEKIVLRYGPVVNSYPEWHPFVCHDRAKDAGYGNRFFRGFEHFVLLRNAVITCLKEERVQEVKNSIAFFENGIDNDAEILCEQLSVKFFNRDSTALLITCNWKKWAENVSIFIPKKVAVARLLETELPCRHIGNQVESWNYMRPHFLGCPHGSKSSLFVEEETGQAMKTIWTSLVDLGVFNP